MAEILKVRMRRRLKGDFNIWVHVYVESLAAPEKQDLGLLLNQLGDSVHRALLWIDDARGRRTNEAKVRDYRAVQSVADELQVQLRKAEQLRAGDAEPLLKAVAALTDFSAMIREEIEFYAAQDPKASS